MTINVLVWKETTLRDTADTGIYLGVSETAKKIF